jgi:hypothetical protein
MWKALRISLLLLILAAVTFHTMLDRRATASWRTPLWIGILPVAGDDSPVTRDYIAALRSDDFAPIGRFMARESRVHGGPAEPVRVVYYPGPFRSLPARSASEGAVANVLWSLRLRWYAWRRMQELDGAVPRVRVFVIYHDPARTVKVPHSVGLQKGLLGVVHAFASRSEQGGNQIVIAHEMLHTLGATDKYGPDGLPLFPDGYADPAQRPLLPQLRAEVMAGRRAVAEDRAEMPRGLADVVLGAATAREINWPAR